MSLGTFGDNRFMTESARIGQHTERLYLNSGVEVIEGKPQRLCGRHG